MIFTADLPSPRGLFQFLGFSSIFCVSSVILWGENPTTVFAPTWTVSGLSVLYLRVMQGTFRMQASSWTPPESV